MRKNELESTDFWTRKQELVGIMGFEANFFQETLGAYHLTKLNSKILGETGGINGNFLEILPVWNRKLCLRMNVKLLQVSVWCICLLLFCKKNKTSKQISLCSHLDCNPFHKNQFV